MLLQAFAIAARMFVKWFILSFFAWVVKNTFDAAVSPWLERPLSIVKLASARVHENFQRRLYLVKLKYASFDAQGVAP